MPESRPKGGTALINMFEPALASLSLRRTALIHAAQGEPGREGCSWYPLWQLVEEIDPAARTRYQVVEVLHFMCGEIIPRWVLCPWRPFRLYELGLRVH